MGTLGERINAHLIVAFVNLPFRVKIGMFSWPQDPKKHNKDSYHCTETLPIINSVMQYVLMPML